MIPIKLTIQGLYSYQQKQTIDFVKLTASNIFGIFGSVGSGKSSILEAITFALYGKTDRLNLSGDNRNYNMMNLKSNELLIDFVFETGKEQTPFRAVVKGKRNSKQFTEVKKLDRTAYQKVGDNWIPVESHVLEEAIGLSYENFKRTIIIPQGQFQEFLQLGNKDRTKMMKELFNLEKFELYYKVAALESKNNEQKQNIQGQLQQLGEIEEAKVHEYETQLIRLKKENETDSKLLSDLQDQETKLRQLQELQQKLNDAKKELTKLNDQVPQFTELKKSIKRYETCHIQFKSHLDALNASNRKIDQKTKQIEKETEQLKLESAGIEKAETLMQKIQIEYDEREKLKQRAEELTKLVEIKGLEKSTSENTKRLKKGEEIWEQTKTKLEKLKSKKEQIEVQVKSNKINLPDLTKLSEIKTWFVENGSYSKQAQDLKDEILGFQNEIGRIKKSIHDLFQTDIFREMPVDAEIVAAKQFLRNRTEAIKKEIKILDSKADHFRIQEKLESYAGSLNEGEPCPLCGSEHHPNVFSAESVKEAKTRIDEEKGVLEKIIEKIAENDRRLDEMENQLTFNKRHLKEREAKRENLETKISKHQEAFKWEKYTNEQELNNAFSLAKTIQTEIEVKEKELETISVQLKNSEINKERYLAEIEKIKRNLTVSQSKMETLKAQLLIVSGEEYQQISSAEITSEKTILLQRHQELEKQFNELSAKLTQLRTTKDTLSGSLKANVKELEEEKKTNADLIQQLNERLSQTEFDSVETVKEILSKPVDREKEKQKLSDFDQKLVLAQNHVKQLEKETGNRIYGAEMHQKLNDRILELKNKLQQGNREFGKIKELLTKLQSDLEKQASLRKVLDQLELRGENIKTLKLLFKGSGFVNYISSVYLQNLCNAANDRFFQLTRQKLSLEISEDNNFRVRDFMNGGKIRSVKTLSGGQTFQAALSLALALADNIQKITESNQNFFFLDEGFGSLDKEALSVVFDTLKSLRKEDRVVGVISHVEEMQQEIDVHLRIENQEEKGSFISNSWMV